MRPAESVWLLGVWVTRGMACGPLDVVRDDDGFGDLAHGLAGVHALRLNAPERVGFLQAVPVNQNALRALDGLAGLAQIPVGIAQVARDGSFALLVPDLF